VLLSHAGNEAAEVKVHLGSKLISLIENNLNKNLIISMSIKHEFR
jgi:hypothetical protein